MAYLFDPPDRGMAGMVQIWIYPDELERIKSERDVPDAPSPERTNEHKEIENEEEVIESEGSSREVE